MNYSRETSFGEVLSSLRHRKGVTQRRLAEQLNISRNTIAAWESSTYLPRDRETLRRLAQVLQLDEHDLRSLEGVMKESVSVLSPIISIRIIEEPLTVYNLNTTISALTELSTKYWLIAKGRFADLIEFTQTHNGQFVEEANVVVTKISYNSPMNMDWKVDLSAPSLAEAIVTTIDGIAQAPQRLKLKDLENQARAQEIQHAEQHAAHEQQMALLLQEQQRLEIEKQRLEVLEHQLEVQKKGIEYALEIAGKVVDLLHPHADSATRAMEIQALLPNLVQLQNGKGLELALPALENEKSTTPS